MAQVPIDGTDIIMAHSLAQLLFLVRSNVLFFC